MKLWLLRHARVTLEPGLCYGASDVPADPALTLDAARHWAFRVPDAAHWRVSGLRRARQLAEAIRTLRPALPQALTDTRLNEMDFGHWELQPWDGIPRPAFDAWMNDFAHHRFGGAESTQMLLDRVDAALVDLLGSGCSEAVWVTHAGVIRAATYLVQGGERPIRDVGRWPGEAPEPGGGLCLEW
ncbi:MAG: histidine phosphatase family protein [Hydrogenophaga sp.]|jgi:alpha-ribazole phosphatase|nr:histidine phosphatase family protein [Hydrogenophaga sp.]